LNVFNRIVMVLVIIVCLVVIPILMTFDLEVISQARMALDTFEAGLYDARFSMIFIIVCGVLLFLLLILLWLEMRRPRRKTVHIKAASGGDAQMGIQSVSQSLDYRIDELAGVRKVQSHIVSRGRDVDVTVDLDTSPSVNIPVLTDQIISLCRDIVETQLGIKIHGPVKVNIRHEPYPRGTMHSTGALAKEPVNAPPTGIKPATPVAADTASWSGASAAVSNANAAPKSEEQKPQGSGDSSGW